MISSDIILIGLVVITLLVGVLWLYFHKKNSDLFSNSNDDHKTPYTPNKDIHHRTEPQIHALGDPVLGQLGFGSVEGVMPTEKLATTIIDVKTEIEPVLTHYQHDVTQTIVAVNVIAKPKSLFCGYDLLQTLLAANLHFGAMSIFHRHERSKGQGRVIFSVAQAVEPGTFDLGCIGSLQCRGLCLFFNVEESIDPLSDLQLLLSTAEKLAEELDGLLQDAEHMPLTNVKIKSYKDNVLRLIRDQLESTV